MNYWIVALIFWSSLVSLVCVAGICLAIVRLAQAVESQFTDGAAAELKTAFNSLRRDFEQTLDSLDRRVNRENMRARRDSGFDPKNMPPAAPVTRAERLMAIQKKLGGVQ